MPLNYILLFTFTLAESYLVASICSLYEEAPEVVLMAAVTTLALFIGLTIFACCCKMMKLTFCCYVKHYDLSYVKCIVGLCSTCNCGLSVL